MCLPLPSQRLVAASWLTAAGSSPRLFVRYLRPRTPSEISPRGPLFSGHTGAAERSVHEGCSRASSTANFFSEKSAPCCAYFPFFSPLPLLCFLFQQISDHCRNLGLHTIFIFGFSFLHPSHLCRMRIFEVSRWLRFSVRIILRMTKGEPLAWCGSQSTKYVKMPP